MARIFGRRVSERLAMLAAARLALLAAGGAAQGQGGQQKGAATPRQAPMPSRPLNFWAQQEKINAWTVGLAAGLIEGAPLRLASEIARVVDDGANQIGR